MSRLPFILGLAAAALAAGCVVHAHGRIPPGHVDVTYVPHGHRYVFYPSHRAYYCSVHDDWWAEDRGRWVRFTVRPPHVRLHADVTWIEIDDDGPEPFVHVEHHMERRHDDGPGRGKGPPPGRGRRKDRDRDRDDDDD